MLDGEVVWVLVVPAVVVVSGFGGSGVIGAAVASWVGLGRGEGVVEELEELL